MKIFATEERQKILDESGVEYKIDHELNFYFSKRSDEEKAIKILRGHLAL
jgi:hypothetical protein